MHFSGGMNSTQFYVDPLRWLNNFKVQPSGDQIKKDEIPDLRI